MARAYSQGLLEFEEELSGLESGLWTEAEPFARRRQPSSSTRVTWRFARELRRQDFLPTIHFIQRFLQRVLSRGLRFDPRTFPNEFYRARHYRQTRPGYYTRIAVVRGVPVLYRMGGKSGNRIVLVGVLPEGISPPSVPTSPPPQREAEAMFEWEAEYTPSTEIVNICRQAWRVANQLGEQLQRARLSQFPQRNILIDQIRRRGANWINRISNQMLPILDRFHLNDLDRLVGCLARVEHAIRRETIPMRRLKVAVRQRLVRSVS